MNDPTSLKLAQAITISWQDWVSRRILPILYSQSSKCRRINGLMTVSPVSTPSEDGIIWHFLLLKIRSGTHRKSCIFLRLVIQLWDDTDDFDDGMLFGIRKGRWHAASTQEAFMVEWTKTDTIWKRRRQASWYVRHKQYSYLMISRGLGSQ